MKLLFFTVIPSPYQRQLFAALNRAPDLDVRVAYYAASAFDREWKGVDLEGYETILPGVTLRFLCDSAHLNPGVLHELRAARADLVVVSDYSAPSAQILMRVLAAQGIPWIFWGEMPGFSERGPIGQWLRRRMQAPLQKATALAAVGERAAEAYCSLLPDKPIFNIPYFCDLTPYVQAGNRARTSGRQKGHIDLLFSGQLIERKGVDVLIKAFIQIADVSPRLRLMLLGSGPQRARFERLVPETLRNRVDFRGHREPGTLPEIFAEADLFCLPSRHDGWGVVVNEALGAGLPIIVSDKVGASADLVSEGVNGRVVPAGNVGALAAAIAEIAGDDTKRMAYAAGSRELARRWGIDEGARRWRNAVTTVMQQVRR